MTDETDSKRRLREQAYDALKSAFDSMAYTAPELMSGKSRDLVVVAAGFARAWGIDDVEVLVDDIRASKARS